MATFAELKTRVSVALQDENNTAISSADVGQAINDAIAFYSEQRFYFNEGQATLNLTVGNPVIAGLPTDLGQLVSKNGLVLNYSNSRYELFHRSPAEYDAMNDEGSGMPGVYTERYGAYQVYPYPDQAYQVQVTYVKEYAALSGDSDTNDFTTEAPELIKYRAVSVLAAMRLQDSGLSGISKGFEDLEAIRLTRKTRKIKSTGSLSVNTILSDY